MKSVDFLFKAAANIVKGDKTVKQNLQLSVHGSLLKEKQKSWSGEQIRFFLG